MSDLISKASAEEKLKQAEEWFQVTLRSIGDAVIATDPHGLVSFMNQVAEELTGWKFEEAKGSPLASCFQIHNEFTKKAVENPAERVLREGSIVGLANHTVLVSRNGRQIPIDDSAAPIRDSSGQLIGVVLVFRDISEKRAAELSSLRLAAIVEDSSDAIIAKDLEGTILSWNKAAEETFHYRSDEMVGKSIRTIIPPDRQDEEDRILASLRRGERVEHFETVRLAKEGRKIDVSLSISPIKDAEGHIVGASKIVRDITRRRQAEIEREFLLAHEREAREEAETLNESAQALGGELDLQTVVQNVTDAATRLTGAKFGALFYNLMDRTGERYMLFTLSGAPREAFEKFGLPRKTEIFKPTFEGQGVIRIRDVLADPRYGRNSPHQGMPPGHLPVRSYLAVPVISRSGEVLGGLFFGHPEPDKFTERSERLSLGIAAQAAIAIDNARLLAERVRSEEALRQAHELLADRAKHLEELVQERTIELRRNVAELEAFSYSLSHDMRAPLRAMQSFSEIVTADYGEKIGPEGKDLLGRIASAAERMDRLIQDVLACSQISREKIVLVPIDVAKLIQDVIRERPELREPRSEISVEGPLEPILGHDASLTQCVTNLLDNAVKFVKRGEKPRIRIYTESVGSDVRLWFHDNGIGIDPAAKNRLFSLFQRIHGGDHYEGTGIGLAIVRRAVERMGGQVGVESEPGKGSRFWLQLRKAQ
jgi:PAS domain S-box-containing protein